MLFIPFIENAFKHGRKSESAPIEILLTSKEKVIELYCSNQKRNLNETEKAGPSGIGIQNIKRRLELLFPNRYQLTISETNKRYDIHLLINIDEN
jgi:sensor histidine kinase YesM